MGCQEKQPALIITGMHRSGTSLVASMCQLIGINIGNRLMPGHKSNPAGHFEDLDFYELHEEILADNNLSAAGFDYSDYKIVVTPEQRARAERLIDERNSTGIPWGWKDPRTVLLLDFWLELIPDAKLLFVYRRPQLVAGSLFRRGDTTFQDDGEAAYRLWHHYNRIILSHAIRHSNSVLLEDLDWIRVNSESFIRRLAGFMSLDVSELVNPLVPEYLHNVERKSDSEITRGLNSNCHRLHESLSQFSAEHRLGNNRFSLHLSGTNERRIAVLIPIHRLPLKAHEETSMSQLRRYLGSYDRIIVAPKSLDLSRLNLPITRFADKWFQNIESYSKLLLSEEFYLQFIDYDYILIYQLDCLVFSSNLTDWCNKEWHYVGAPWFHNFSTNPNDGLWACGNGGLSLRHIKAALQVLGMSKIREYLDSHIVPEDLFWSFDAPKHDPSFIVPDTKSASSFAVEGNPRYFFRLNGNRLPFGCHYWNRVDPDFWLFFIDRGSDPFSSPGTKSLLNMDHPDSEWTHEWLRKFFQHILIHAEPLTVARILTSEIDLKEIIGAPTREGIDLSFHLLLGRKPGEDWYDYWIGRPESTLLDVIRDLAKGEEFCLKIKRIQSFLSSPDPDTSNRQE